MGHKKHSEEHENAERWLLTYADMITLLMAFFILMYTMSKVDSQKLAAVSRELKGRLGGGIMPVTGSKEIGFIKWPDERMAKPGIDKPGNPVKPNSFPSLAIKNIKNTLKRNHLENDVRLRMDDRGLIISLIGNDVLFDIQSAKIRPAGEKALDSIGIMLEEISNKIDVEGHTDEQRALSRADPAVSWFLSSNRALSVLTYLMKKNYVTESRLSLSAFAANHPLPPVAGMSDEERRRLSRRVDLVIFGSTPKTAKEAAAGGITYDDMKRGLEIGW